jgi:hypothetical protein
VWRGLGSAWWEFGGGFLIAMRWSKEESIGLDFKGVCRGFHYLDS